MSKIENDKYYTPLSVAKYCIDKTYSIIGEDNISEVLEPSAGDGVFSRQIYTKPCIAYDIEPQHPTIIEGDFLTQDISYQKGRLVIGNPPYGRCLNMAQKFFKKSVEISDYIAFILPISQLNNTRSMYEFDLIYSEDLGVHTYTDRKLHCCFNIYRRPDGGGLNKRILSKLQDITIYRQDSSKYKEQDFDIRMCYWGDGTAGKILKEGESYSAEYKIKIHNQDLRDKVIDTLNDFDWKKYLSCIAMRKIQQFHIINVLQNAIPEIK